MERSSARRYATIVATFGFALGIGFLMQNGDAVASRLGVDNARDGQQPSAEDDYTPVRAYGATPEAGENLSDPSDDEANAGCDVTFEATPGVAAMVNLELSAPCHLNTLVTLQHQGMKFHSMTDDNGLLKVDVPALSQEAIFVATLDQGNGHVAITGVPDVVIYDRTVLQWRGETDLQLHAYEFGAADGEDGHVWKAANRTPVDSVKGDAGFLTTLGTTHGPASLMAQVYSYPTGINPQDGNVALSVKTVVSPDNCGGTLSAQSIQLRPDHPPAARNMSMRVPDCDVIGEFLVLKNMFEDLTLAAK